MQLNWSNHNSNRKYNKNITNNGLQTCAVALPCKNLPCTMHEFNITLLANSIIIAEKENSSLLLIAGKKDNSGIRIE